MCKKEQSGCRGGVGKRCVCLWGGGAVLFKEEGEDMCDIGNQLCIHAETLQLVIKSSVTLLTLFICR